MQDSACPPVYQVPDASLSLDSNRTTQTKSSKLKRCPTPVGYFEGIGSNPNGTTRAISGMMRCGRWACEFCGDVNRRRLKKRAYEGHIARVKARPGFRPNPYGVKMMTLTCPGAEWRSHMTPEAAADLMAKNFAKLIAAIRKMLGTDFEYLRVIEPQRDGFPHYHVMLNGNAIAPKGLLPLVRRLWRDKYGMGNIDIQVMRYGVKAGINYCLKYITKDIRPIRKGGRVFSSSRDALVPRERYWTWYHTNVLLGFAAQGREGATTDIEVDLAVSDEQLRAAWPHWDHFEEQFKEKIRREAMVELINQAKQVFQSGGSQ